MKKDKVKVGLMLGGGGAKGAYQLGVIKALEEAQLINYIKAISGTSIGAINTLLLMSKRKHEDISKIWELIDKDNVFGTKGTLLSKDNRMYSLKPLSETLIKEISLKSIQKSKFKGFATTSKMYHKVSILHQIKTDTMEKRVFNLNEFSDPYIAVMASASFPVVFGPTQIGDDHYVDGGLLDNYPIQPLIDAGCNLILAVALDDRFNPNIYDNTNINIINFTAQTAFEKNILKDLMDVMKFDHNFKSEKEEIGYVVGKIMIKKMYEERYLTRFMGMNFWYKRPNFKVLGLSPEDELYLKRLSVHKKRKKLILKEPPKGDNL